MRRQIKKIELDRHIYTKSDKGVYRKLKYLVDMVNILVEHINIEIGKMGKPLSLFQRIKKFLGG